MLLDDMLPDVLVDAPECPDPTARRALIRAAQEFCNDTLAWSAELAAIPLVDGQADYVITPPANAEPVTVVSAKVNGVPLRPGWCDGAGSLPRWFNCRDGEDSVIVSPIPGNLAGETLVLRVAFGPTEAATELPDALWRAWGETLVNGALARLMLQPRKPWSNAQLGAFNGGRFAAGKLEARIKTVHGGVPGELRVPPTRPFGF